MPDDTVVLLGCQIPKRWAPRVSNFEIWPLMTNSFEESLEHLGTAPVEPHGYTHLTCSRKQDRSQIRTIDASGVIDTHSPQPPYQRHPIGGHEIRVVHCSTKRGLVVRGHDIVHSGNTDIAGLAALRPFCDSICGIVVASRVDPPPHD